MEFKTFNHGFGMGVAQSHTCSLQGGCKRPYCIASSGFAVLLGRGESLERTGWRRRWCSGEEHLEDSQQLFFINWDETFSLF